MRAIFLVPFLLAACSDDPQVAPSKLAASCRFDRVAELPMAAGTPYAIVPAKIDGQSVSLLLDTGDERLTIRPQAQRDLRLPEDRNHRTMLTGVGGTASSFDAIIQRLEFGDTEIPQSGAVIGEFDLPVLTDPPVVGILGGHALAGYDVEFDFTARRVTFWQSSDCPTLKPAWNTPYTSVRLARTGGDLVTLDVLINNQHIRALLDTGARNTTLSAAAAARVGIAGATLSAARVSVRRGADGNDVISRVARVGNLAFGGAHISNAAVLVSPLHVPFAEMLLGVDMFQHHDLWLSYGSQQMFLK